MKELSLTVRPVTEEAMSALEERALLQRLLPSSGVLKVPEGAVEVERTYTTDPQFGSHMLICVGFNRSKVELAIHPDNEDFILINEGREQKPLILVIGLHPEPEFQRLVSTGQLTADDIWALEMKFNDPRLSFFTMNGFTPHCEWTMPGPGPASVFFVTEPSGLDLRPISMGDYTLKIAYSSPGSE
jgi:hypothetical protein